MIMKKSVLLRSIFCLVFFPLWAFARNSASMPGLPDGFIKNEGQVHDAHGGLLKDVLYTSTSSQGTYLFFSDKIMFLPVMESKVAKTLHGTKAKKTETKATLLQLLFEGADKNVSVDGITPSDVAFNYYTKSSERPITAKMYSKIIYHNLYKGIDLVFYYKDGSCEYDLVAEAGADPSLIRLRFSGQQRIETDKNGSLAVLYKGGKWAHGAPVCFQDDTKIASHYIISGNRVGFALGKYDVSKPLTIDPVMVHATFFGGNSDESLSRMKTDASGNLFIAGYTPSSASMPLTNPGGGAYYQSTYVFGSYYDAFIAKFSSSGTLLWCTYYGDGSEANGFDMDVSPAGNIAICGSTLGTGFPVYNPGGGAYFVGTTFGPQSGYIAEFNVSGVRLWATLIGPGGYGGLSTLAYDPFGNLFVAAVANSTFPLVNPGGGAYQQTLSGTDVMWVGKFNSSRSLVWGTFHCSSYGDYPQSMACDASGNVAVTGTTQSMTTFPTYNPGGGAYYQATGTTNPEGFIVKFSNTGVRLWSTYVGGNGDDELVKSGFDNFGNLYVSGYSLSTNFPVVNSGGGSYFQGTRGGTQDGIFQKFDASNALVHSSYLGGTAVSAIHGLNVKNNYVYLAAYTTGSGLAMQNAFQGTSGGGYDAVVMKLNNQMIVNWSSYYGGSADEGAYCIAAGNGNDVYFGGFAKSGFPTINSGSFYYKGTVDGTYDAFIAKLNDIPLLPTVTSVNPLAANPGTVVGITGTNFNTVPANNIVFFGATKATVTAATTT